VLVTHDRKHRQTDPSDLLEVPPSNVVAAEWTKLRSVRSTYWLLLGGLFPALLRDHLPCYLPGPAESRIRCQLNGSASMSR
jgi:hypothetical protein